MNEGIKKCTRPFHKTLPLKWRSNLLQEVWHCWETHWPDWGTKSWASHNPTHCLYFKAHYYNWVKLTLFLKLIMFLFRLKLCFTNLMSACLTAGFQFHITSTDCSSSYLDTSYMTLQFFGKLSGFFQDQDTFTWNWSSHLYITSVGSGSW